MTRINELALKVALASLIVFTILASVIGYGLWIPEDPLLMSNDTLKVLWGFSAGVFVVWLFQGFGMLKSPFDTLCEGGDDGQ